MIELKTPLEILESLVKNIENRRKREKLRQKDLCEMADVALSTYQAFLYKKSINIISLIKIMYVLKMWDNLDALIHTQESMSIEDIRRAKKREKLPKRIRKKDAL